MTAHSREALATSQRQLNICAEIHCMRVAALWQVLMPVAGDIRNVKISIGQADGYADIAVSFDHRPSASLGAIAERISDMTWVTNATLS
jgi:hypothetical protein